MRSIFLLFIATAFCNHAYAQLITPGGGRLVNTWSYADAAQQHSIIIADEARGDNKVRIWVKGFANIDSGMHQLDREVTGRGGSGAFAS
jgi:hypothetical protein